VQPVLGRVCSRGSKTSLLVPTKRALSGWSLDGRRAIGMDDEEQPARHGSALAADCRGARNSRANVALLRLPQRDSGRRMRRSVRRAVAIRLTSSGRSGRASACDHFIVEHRHLGRTGVSVSKFCLGAMMFGAWGNADHEESIRIIHRALDAGINFIDTADVYGQGESEEIVGKSLAGGRRDNVFLATKFHNAMGEDPNQQGNARRWIMRAVEDSLRRLGTDWIDLYQVHRPDPSTDVEETLGALTDLVHAGKVRYIGHSTFPASQIVEAQWAARDRGFQRFVTEQPPYSMLVRAVEADVLPTCLRHGMGVMSYSPLTGGWLSGRWRKETGQQSSSRAGRLPERFDLANPYNQRKLDAVEELARLADEAGLTLIQLAIAFVLNHPAITAALIGPRTMEQLESQLAAADITLDDAVLDRIDEIVPPGITINPADNSFANPALEPAARRRPR
jgi:aryl-alcohol dehydrogenase-like predicted oxidoreductase